MKKKLALTIAFLIGSLALLSAFAGSADASGHSTEITSCGTIITSPGEYHLEGDLTNAHGSCISIWTDGVTLDGQGYSIVGPGPSLPDGTFDGREDWSVGVADFGLDGPNEIRNLVITGMTTGIEAANFSAAAITGNRIAENDIGIFVSGNNIDISRNVFEANGIGATDLGPRK